MTLGRHPCSTLIRLSQELMTEHVEASVEKNVPRHSDFVEA